MYNVLSFNVYLPTYFVTDENSWENSKQNNVI